MALRWRLASPPGVMVLVICLSACGGGGAAGGSGSQSATQPQPPPPPPTIIPVSIVGHLPEAVMGLQYHGQLQAKGGTSPYTWSTNGAPPGLAVDSKGNVTGTPTAFGN